MLVILRVYALVSSQISPCTEKCDKIAMCAVMKIHIHKVIQKYLVSEYRPKKFAVP